TSARVSTSAATGSAAGRSIDSPAPWLCSVSGEDAIDQLLHRRGEVVRVERVPLEAECAVAGEHQVLVDVAAVGDVLQRLLDAEAARIGEAAGGVVVVVLP